jgi:hypothetical protein
MFVDIGLGDCWFGCKDIRKGKQCRALFADKGIIEDSVMELVEVLSRRGVE